MIIRRLNRASYAHFMYMCPSYYGSSKLPSFCTSCQTISLLVMIARAIIFEFMMCSVSAHTHRTQICMILCIVYVCRQYTF